MTGPRPPQCRLPELSDLIPLHSLMLFSPLSCLRRCPDLPNSHSTYKHHCTWCRDGILPSTSHPASRGSSAEERSPPNEEQVCVLWRTEVDQQTRPPTILPKDLLPGGTEGVAEIWLCLKNKISKNVAPKGSFNTHCIPQHEGQEKLWCVVPSSSHHTPKLPS